MPETVAEQEEYDFRGRRSNEKVVLVVRYHPWLLMPIVFAWVIVIAIIVTIVWLFGASSWSSIVVAVSALIGLVYSLYRWFIWNNGNYIITNQRVIRTEQINLFRKQISEAEIDRIQEIATEIDGPLRTLLNFGTVKIRTAGGTGQVDIEDVADPYDIQQEIARVQRQIVEQATGSRRPYQLS